MRDLLTVLAVALIATLLVALVGPYFIDWSSQRARIDAALGQALGLEVETRGAIDLRLLPSPALRLEGAVVWGRRSAGADGAVQPDDPVHERRDQSPRRPLLTTGRLKAELALAPLLGGKWRIVDAAIDRPVLRLDLPQGGAPAVRSLEAGQWTGPALAPSLDSLRITNGVIIVSDLRNGRRLVREGVDAHVQAAELSGPWRISGTVGATPFQLATGALEPDGVMRLRASLGDAAASRADFDGQLQLPPDAAPGFAGRITLTSSLTQDGGGLAVERDQAFGGVDPGGKAPQPSRVRLTSEVRLAAGKAEARQIRIELGDPAAPLRLEGSGGGDIGGGQDLALDLRARRLDLAGLAGLVLVPGESALAATPHALQNLLRKIDALAAPLPVVRARLGVDALAWGEEETGPAALTARMAGGVLTVEQGRVALPGGASLELSGDTRATPRPFTAMSVRLAAPQPAAFAAMLRRLEAPPDLVAWLGRQKKLTLSGRFGLSPETVSAHPLKLETDAGALTGMIVRTAGETGAPARINAQLAARGLDLSDFPGALWAGRIFSPGAQPKAGAGPDVAGPPDVSVSFTGAALRLGAAAALGSVHLRASRSGAGVEIGTLELSNLGGVDLSASGQLAGGGKPLAGRLQAPGMAPLVSLAEGFGLAAGQGPWGQIWRALRGPVFASPVQLAFTTAMQPGGGAVLRLEGKTSGGNGFSARAEGALNFEPSPGENTPELAGGPLSSAGGRLASADGRLASAGGRLAFTGGRLALSGDDASPLLAALSPGFAARAVPRPGAGPWRASFELSSKAVSGLPGVQAAMDVNFAGARFTLKPQGDGAALMLAADNATALAEAFGWSQPLSGGVNLDGRLAWSGDRRPWRLDFQGNAAGAPVSGAVSPLGERGVAAQIKLETLSLPLLAQMFVLGPASPPVADALWSSRRFGDAPFSFANPATGAPRALELSVQARRLDLGAGFSVADASIGVSGLEDGVRLALQPAILSTPAGGQGEANRQSRSNSATAATGNAGKLAGALLLRRQGGGASLAGDFRLADATLAEWGVRGLEGRADVDLRFGAAGESPAALVANLAGNGAVHLRQGSLLHTAPSAPTEAAARFASDAGVLAGGKLAGLADGLLAQGTFGPVNVTAPIVMSGGVARLRAPPVTIAGSSLGGDVTIDLRSLKLEANARLAATAAPPGWKGAPPSITLSWRGPLAAPVRTLEVGELQTGLAALRLDEELRRVEAWKAQARQLQEENRRRQEEDARRSFENAQENAHANSAGDAKAAEGTDAAFGRGNAQVNGQGNGKASGQTDVQGRGQDIAPSAPLPPQRPGSLQAAPDAPPQLAPQGNAKPKRPSGLQAPPGLLFAPTPEPRFQ